MVVASFVVLGAVAFLPGAWHVECGVPVEEPFRLEHEARVLHRHYRPVLQGDRMVITEISVISNTPSTLAVRLIS